MVSAALPSGSLSKDSDGVTLYTLSDADIRKLRNLVLGILSDSGGKPAFRIARVDEALLPAILEKYGLYLFGGLAAVFILGRYTRAK